MNSYIRRTKFHAIKIILLCVSYSIFLLASYEMFSIVEDLTLHYFLLSVVLLLIISIFALKNFFAIDKKFQRLQTAEMINVKESELMEWVMLIAYETDIPWPLTIIFMIPIMLFAVFFLPVLLIIPLLITTRTFLTNKETWDTLTLYSIFSLDMKKLKKAIHGEGLKVRVEK